MRFRIKIDLEAGILEVEGTEELVREVFSEFWAKRSESKGPEEGRSSNKRSATTRREEPPMKKVSTTRSPSRRMEAIKNLDLVGGGKKESLSDMVERLKPKSNFERNLIFVHYVSEVCGIESVTSDHVYTCYYVTAGMKIPAHLRQSLWDTSARRGWLDTASLEDISITTPGINYLEHDMSAGATPISLPTLWWKTPWRPS